MASDTQCVGSVLLTAERIQQRVCELGAEISSDYMGREVLMVGVLKGAMVFMADLMRATSIPVRVDMIGVSSYIGRKSTNEVRFTKPLDSDIDGCDVILVEDIIDSGLTLHRLLAHIETQRPASIAVCALLNKTAHRRVDVHIDYIGFDIPDKFVVGYGLDYDEQYRNLPYIAALI